jgi:hypothetical protein
MSLAYSPAYADCDFSKDIQKQADGSYSYTKDCHVEVGKKVGALEKREKQVEQLEKVVELKELALDKSYQRIEMWRETTYKIEDRANSMEEFKKRNETLYFVLGIVAGGLIMYGASQMQK